MRSPIYLRQALLLVLHPHYLLLYQSTDCLNPIVRLRDSCQMSGAAGRLFYGLEGLDLTTIMEVQFLVAALDTGAQTRPGPSKTICSVSEL